MFLHVDRSQLPRNPTTNTKTLEQTAKTGSCLFPWEMETDKAIKTTETIQKNRFPCSMRKRFHHKQSSDSFAQTVRMHLQTNLEQPTSLHEHHPFSSTALFPDQQ